MTPQTIRLVAPRQIAIAILLTRLAWLLCATAQGSLPLRAAEPGAEPGEAAATSAAIALADFGDAAARALALRVAVAALVTAPLARRPCRRAAVPAPRPRALHADRGLRLSTLLVDGWEGRVNDWPLDLGLIDSVAGDHATGKNDPPTLNMIATPHLHAVGSQD